MFSPARRTAQIAAWASGSSARVTPHPGPVPRTTSSRRDNNPLSAPSPSPANSTSSSVWAAAGKRASTVERNAAILPGQAGQGVVHQLNGVGLQFDDVLHGVERIQERREGAHAEHPAGRPARQLQPDPAEEGQGALRPHQNLGRRGPRSQQTVQVVPCHVTEDFRHAPLQFRRLPRRDSADRLHQVVRRRPVPPEHPHPPIRQHRLDGQHVVGHDPVADRAGPAAVVARHPPDGGAARGRHVHREEQPRRSQSAVQAVEHNARLHPHGPALPVHRAHLAQIPRSVHNQRAPDRLPALRSPRPPGQHRHPFLARDRHGRVDVVERARKHHPDRLDLVDGCVGRIKAPRERVEANRPLHVVAQPGGQGGKHMANCE